MIQAVRGVVATGSQANRRGGIEVPSAGASPVSMQVSGSGLMGQA